MLLEKEDYMTRMESSRKGNKEWTTLRKNDLGKVDSNLPTLRDENLTNILL